MVLHHRSPASVYRRHALNLHVVGVDGCVSGRASCGDAGRLTQQAGRRAAAGRHAIGFLGVALVLPTLQRDQWVRSLGGRAARACCRLTYLQVQPGACRPGARGCLLLAHLALAGLLIPAGLTYLSGHPGLGRHPMGWVWLLGIGGFATVAHWPADTGIRQGQALVNASPPAYLGIATPSSSGVLLF